MSRTEVERVTQGPAPGERPRMSVPFLVRCPGNAEEVLDKARTVMHTILRCAHSWSDVDRWREDLPSWFVGACAAEVSREEAERQVSRPLEERVRTQELEGWSLSAWLFWFKPEERQWTWWDAKVRSQDLIALTVEVEGWPFPWGALEWLFRASGATDVEPANDG